MFEAAKSGDRPVGGALGLGGQLSPDGGGAAAGDAKRRYENTIRYYYVGFLWIVHVHMGVGFWQYKNQHSNAHHRPTDLAATASNSRKHIILSKCSA
eukprot:6183560-Pleurochrysis_carterae.AAC.1